tara:strand:- start:7731 stop:7970 length:240 start_codon:yes stop_codon:yes gene_type:complete
MKIQIEYFALLKEQRGTSIETIETKAANPEILYSDLKRQYSFSLEPSVLKLAVNEDFANWDYSLKDGDTVVFIPPVAGG